MIDANLRHAYETDGVVCLRGAFDAGWLAVVSDAIEQGRANPGPMYVDYSAQTKPGTYCGDFWTWQQVPAMRTFIFESPAARIVGEVMGVPSVMLVTDNWLIREAGAVNKAPWHHDAPYFDLDGKWCVLWMALEPVGPGEGIVVLKGSHRWGRNFMPESFAGTGPKAEPQGPYERTPDFARELERHVPVEYSLEPGDCLVFDAFTVHGVARDLGDARQPAPHHAIRRRRCRLPPARSLDARNDGVPGTRARPGGRGSVPLRAPSRPVVEGRRCGRAGPMNGARGLVRQRAGSTTG